MINIDKNNKKIQVAVSGGMGSMGQLVTKYILDSDNYELTGIYDPINKNNKFQNFDSIEEIKADILFEFAPSDTVNLNIEKIDTTSLNLIVGSSGIQESSIDHLQKNASDERFVCVIPNFSVGAALQKIFAKILNDTFLDVKIEERHHSGKQDAPSGTAIDLAQSLTNSSKTSSVFSDSESAEINIVNNVNIKSLRGDEYLAEQLVYFQNKDEKFSMGHVVDDRTAYLNGIGYLLNVHHELKGFHYGLESIMSERFNI